MHVNVLRPSTHVPGAHGLDAGQSTTSTQLGPLGMNPLSQTHLKPFTSSTQWPPGAHGSTAGQSFTFTQVVPSLAKPELHSQV